MREFKTNFPDQFIDPDSKDEKWHLQEAKAIYDEWYNLKTSSFANGADRYKTNRLYSNGSQGQAKYREKFMLDDDPDTSYMNIDFEPIPIIPKFRRITNEKIAAIDIILSAEAVDEFALKDKKNYENRERANILLRNQLKSDGVDHSVLNTGEPDQPMDNESLAMKMKFSYKHNMAIDIEKRIDAVFQSNNIDELRSTIRRDLFDYGVAGYKDWIDPSTGEVKVRTVDGKNLVVSPSKDPYFRDAKYVGEYLFLSIEELRRISEGKFTEDQLEAIAESFAGQYGNPKQFGDATPYSYAYDSAVIPVMDMEFRCIDRTAMEKRFDKRGNEIYGNISLKDSEKSEKKGREVSYNDEVVWYKYKWILNSDYIFDIGPISNIKRRPSRMWDAIPNYHLAAPELDDFETRSVVDQLIPIVDSIIFAWLKLQNVIMTARPNGIMIEIGALENVSFGEGGEDEKETVKPLQLIDMFNQSGVLVYRAIDQAGELTGYKPIGELKNGLGEDALSYFAVINNEFNLMRDMLAFNDFTDGTSPDPRALKGVGDMAVKSTDNAIMYLVRAELNLLQRLADSVAIRVHDAIALNETSYYDNILGSEALKSIKEDKNSIHREYGIKVNIQGSKEEVARLNEDIAIAIKNNQITVADKIIVQSIRNLKQAGEYLTYIIEKRSRESFQRGQEDKMSTAKVQVESANAATQNKLAEINAEKEAKAYVEKIKGEEARKTLQLKAELERQHLYADKSIPEIQPFGKQGGDGDGEGQ